MDAVLAALLDDVADRLDRGAGKLVILTGAGLSADSGLPTFRGPDGYWTVGSVRYHPEEIVTRKSWDTIPDQVWRFCALLMRAAAEIKTESQDSGGGHRDGVVLATGAEAVGQVTAELLGRVGVGVVEEDALVSSVAAGAVGEELLKLMTSASSSSAGFVGIAVSAS